MFTDLIEVGHKMKKQMKGTQSEIKQNFHGTNTNSNGKETSSKQQCGTKGKNKHPSRSKWRNKNSKSDETHTNLWDNLKRSNIRIIGVPEGEEEDQEIENLFEQIMKENFPNLAKEIDFQEVQEA